MPYDEEKTQLALRRTLHPIDGTSAPTVSDLDKCVIVLAEDLYALREVALARGDYNRLPRMWAALDVLDKEKAVYGSGVPSVTMDRQSYEALGAPRKIEAAFKEDTR